MSKHVLPYNMKKPYKLVVSPLGSLLIQNGMVYQYGSGVVLGPVATMLKADNKEVIYCKFSGATFPNTAQGKIALDEYQSRKGYVNKESDGSKPDKESTLEERKAAVAEKRAKIHASKE